MTEAGRDPLDWLRKLRAQLARLDADTARRRREIRFDMHAEVEHLIGDGWTPTRIAEAFGVSRSAVNQWRMEPDESEAD